MPIHFRVLNTRKRQAKKAKTDDISLKWYEGVGRKAASERWAFAFSAKKAWKSKVKDDVKKINSTGRKYAQIFFMSNQAISDKKRAETEDLLEKEYGVPVHILDKLWIIDDIPRSGKYFFPVITVEGAVYSSFMSCDCL